MINTGPQIQGQLVPLSPRSLISWCRLRTFLVFISWATLSVSVCLAGTDSPYLLNFMSIITLCSRKHETSLRWAHNSRCFILSVLPSFFFLFLCLVTLWLSCIRYLFSESGLRLWAHSFILKWTSLRILVVSLCVPAFDSFKTANLLSENLCRSESSHGSFITKYSLVIKGNGAGKVRHPEYEPSLHGCHAEGRCH